MKRYLALLLVLAIVWLVWSGHFNGFLLSMGALSCLFVLWISIRMKIVDEEGVPIQLGVGPQLTYFSWLAKEILISNLSVIKIVMSKRPKIRRALVKISTSPQTDIGRVLMANSITLTPGTVTTDVQEDSMQIHALVNPGLDDPTIREIERRVRILEGS